MLRPCRRPPGWRTESSLIRPASAGPSKRGAPGKAGVERLPRRGCVARRGPPCTCAALRWCRHGADFGGDDLGGIIDLEAGALGKGADVLLPSFLAARRCVTDQSAAAWSVCQMQGFRILVAGADAAPLPASSGGHLWPDSHISKEIDKIGCIPVRRSFRWSSDGGMVSFVTRVAE